MPLLPQTASASPTVGFSLVTSHLLRWPPSPVPSAFVQTLPAALALGVLQALPGAAWAQAVDPGRVFESVQPPATEPAPPKAPSVNAPPRNAPQPSEAEAGALLVVKRWRIEGAKSLSVDKLEAVVADTVEKNLSVAQLQEVADRVAQVYRDAGFLLTTAQVLPQTIDGGVVTITVQEDRLEQVEADTQTPAPALALRAVRKAQPEGQPVNTQALEHTLLLTNAWPGAGRSSAELSPGTQEGGSVVKLRYEPASAVSGAVQLDNTGNRFTGRERVTGSLSVAEPFGLGDRLSATLLSSGKALSYGQLGYRLPVGLATSAGVALSALRYELCCQPVDQNADGSVQSLSVDLSQFWHLQRTQQVSGFAALELRRQRSAEAGLDQTDRDALVLQLGVRGQWLDAAKNDWSAALHWGDVDLSGNATDAASDAAGAQVAGRFTKLVGSFTREQNVGSGWSWQWDVRGQAGLGRNLESAERFSLGGADGVRAYPSGEAVGDSGLLTSAEVRYELASLPALSFVGFFDAGGVRQFSKSAVALSKADGTPQRYGLSGLGFGVRYAASYASGSLTLAHPLGNNRGADAEGRNADGKADGDTQAWLSLSVPF